MGFLKNLGKKLGIVQLDDKEKFEQKINGMTKSLEERKLSSDEILANQLEYAYEDYTIESAFWWYEHLPEKLDLSSDSAIVKLSNKWVKVGYFSNRDFDFLNLVFPDDLNYSGIVDNVNSKANFIKALLQHYGDVFRQEGNRKKYPSPFILSEVWALFHRDIIFDESGKLDTEVYKDTFLQWYKSVRLLWIENQFLMNVAEK